MRNLLDSRNYSVNVYEKVGDSTPLKVTDLAKHGQVALHETDTLSSTSKQYGFMELVYGKGYKPIGAVCNVLRKPQAGEESVQYLAAFTKPDIYQKIITEYKGKEIPHEGLEIFLIRNHEFSDGGAKQCVKIFIENAKFLGLINNEGIFNIDASIVISPPEEKIKKTKIASTKNGVSNEKKAKTPIPPLHFFNNNGAGSINNKGIKTIKVWIRSKPLLVPVLEDMTADDWEAFIGQLQDKKN